MHGSRTLGILVWEWFHPAYILSGMAFVHFFGADQSVLHFTLGNLALLILIELLCGKRPEWSPSGRFAWHQLFYVVGVTFLWAPYLHRATIGQVFPLLQTFRAALIGDFVMDVSHPVLLFACPFLILLVQDFFGYWLHRFLHSTRVGWRLHAVHHHTTKLNSMTGFTNHPLEQPIISGLPIAVTLLILPIGPNLSQMYICLLILTAPLVHSNLPVRPGLFGSVFTTCAQHSIHHSTRRQYSDSNFADYVILWDKVFGTYRFTEESLSAGNGTGRQLTVWQEMITPFMPWRKLSRL